MEDITKRINNVCRVCLKNPPAEMVSLNKTQMEKLTFIGDSSKIIRFNGLSPKLCTYCGTNLDSVYDFIFKLRLSTVRMKQEELIKDNQNRSDGDNTRRVDESSPVTKTTTTTTPSPPSYEVTLPSGSFVIHDVVDAEPSLREFDVLQRPPHSIVALNCERVEPKPDPRSEGSPSPLTTSKSKTVDELSSRQMNTVKSDDYSEQKPQTENGYLSSDSNDTEMCEICDVAFTSKKFRHVHEYSGPGFACPDQGCDFIFTQKANLDKHIKSHKVIEPFPCQLGDKAFTNRIHSEDEGYSNGQSLQNGSNA